MSPPEDALKLVDDDDAEGAEIIDLVRLPKNAHPIPFAALEYEEVDGRRDLDCESYKECLDFVAGLHWKGFSCKKCPRFQAVPNAAPAAAPARLIWFRSR